MDNMTEKLESSGFEKLETNAFRIIEKNSGFEIIPVDTTIDLKEFEKLRLSSSQKAQFSALIQHAPLAMAAGTLGNAYTVRFPKGLPHTLTALRQGGVSSIIRADGRIVGSASFYSTAAAGAVLGAFTVLSAVTGQFFLANIYRELDGINKKLDEILAILYEEQRAELMSEISFVQYAHNNFNSIVMRDDQRTATIGSLQASRKTAMKYIEFYLHDLERKSKEEVKDSESCGNNWENVQIIIKRIEVARQLYLYSGLLELFYAQNYEEDYIENIKKDMIDYITFCDNKIVIQLGHLSGKVESCSSKAKRRDKADIKEKFKEITKENDARVLKGDSQLRSWVEKTLNSLHRAEEYYVTAEGDVYVKQNA